LRSLLDQCAHDVARIPTKPHPYVRDPDRAAEARLKSILHHTQPFHQPLGSDGRGKKDAGIGSRNSPCSIRESISCKGRSHILCSLVSCVDAVQIQAIAFGSRLNRASRKVRGASSELGTRLCSNQLFAHPVSLCTPWNGLSNSNVADAAPYARAAHRLHLEDTMKSIVGHPSL
jgi:hypothetical protein